MRDMVQEQYPELYKLIEESIVIGKFNPAADVRQELFHLIRTFMPEVKGHHKISVTLSAAESYLRKEKAGGTNGLR